MRSVTQSFSVKAPSAVLFILTLQEQCRKFVYDFTQKEMTLFSALTFYYNLFWVTIVVDLLLLFGAVKGPDMNIRDVRPMSMT